MRIYAILSSLVMALLPTLVFGADYMKPLRDDHTIPQACRNLDVQNFDPDELEYVTFSIEGGNKKGFTYEYPMDRSEATLLWKYMRSYIENGNYPNPNSAYLKELFLILVDNYEAMDFDFHSEGEILEALAIIQLRSQISEDYFVTGSLQYNAKTAGELDVVVGRKSDCRVEIVGEAKLNIKKLNHAKSQLQRFKSFIHQYSPN